MPLPSLSLRVWSLTTALPTALVATGVVGYLMTVHPVSTAATSPASSTIAAGSGDHSSSASSSLEGHHRSTPRDAAHLPLRVEEPVTVIVGHRQQVVRHAHDLATPSAKHRDQAIAKWLADGGAASVTRLAAAAMAPGVDTSASTAQIDAARAAAGSATSPYADTTGTDTGTVGTGTGATGTGTTPTVGTGKTADFVLSTFNVLGASHTRNGARCRASGVTRINGVAALLNRHAVDVAGFQELQQEQARALLSVTNNTWSLWPGPGKGRDSENSVGWRTSEFEMVRGTTIPIPYFNGHHRNMPVVLLRNRASGVAAWFANFHNPAETSQYHHQQHWRNLATDAEIALANRTRPTGVPLFITGDMNERATYFCRLTAGAAMVAAHGGSNGPSGCQAGRPRAVDWIFGTPGVTFSGYDEDRTHLVDITTDHPVLSTHVRLSGAVFPNALN